MTTQGSGETAPRKSMPPTGASVPRRAASRQAGPAGSVRLVGQGARRMALVVLGMHRSGTSALTRVFSLLGAGLPATLLGANPTNPTGHWESDAVRVFNDGALAAAGTDWFDWLPMNEGWSRSLAYQGQVERGREVLRAEFGEAPLFAIKDPRMCRLAGFWLDVLDAEGVEPVIVMPLRNPLEVAESLARRDGVDGQVALLVWLRHVLEAEAATRGRARLVVSYEQVLDQWAGVAERVERELGVVWPRAAIGVSEEVEGFLSQDLRHHRRSDRAVVDNPLISGWVRRAYAVLQGWAEGAERPSDHDELDLIRAAMDEAGPAFARPLRRIVQQQQQLADLAEQRAGLEARIEGLAGEVARSEQQRQAAADGLGEVARAYQGAQARLDEMALREARGGEEREALAREVAGLRTQAQFMEQRAQEAQARVVMLGEEAEQLRHALQAHQHRAAELESALIQRQEEVEQAWTALEKARAEAVEAASEAAGEMAARHEAASEMAARHESEQEQARAHAAILTEGLEQERRRSAGLGEELAREREQGAALLDALEQERQRGNWLAQGLEQAQGQQAGLLGEVEAGRALLQEQAGELGAAMEQLGAMAETLTVLRGAFADQGEALEVARAENAALREEMRQAQGAALHRQSEATGEIVELARLLQATENEVAQLHGQLLQVQQESAEQQKQRIMVEGEAARWQERWQEVEQGRALMFTRHQQAEQTWGEKARLYERRVIELEQARDGATEQGHALLADKMRLEQQLSERFGELAAMTGLLSSESEKAHRSAAQAQWLQQVHRVTARRPRWWGMMPQRWQRYRLAQRLVEAELFDGDAYLARYPDVAAQGADPLRHYILFGMAEGRVRG